MNIPIIHRDADLVVVNKPAGLLVHPTELASRGEPTLVDTLRDQLGADVFPAHRLDRATSGVMLLSLNRPTARRLGQMFSRGEVDKTYLAVVRGWPDDTGVIDNPVRDRDRPDRPRKDAVTRYQTLHRSEIPVAIEGYPASRFSLVRLSPLTGRRHQLRLHMKHIHHPMIGDTSFGRGAYNRYFRETVGVRRLLLHAHSLELVSPSSSAEAMKFSSPVDKAFVACCDHVGLATFLAGANA